MTPSSRVVPANNNICIVKLKLRRENPAVHILVEQPSAAVGVVNPTQTALLDVFLAGDFSWKLRICPTRFQRNRVTS